ncbi:MAG: hypothetical protein E7174_00915 [Firmicutes bacterium]|nr:hypothetical protein [Bacillota bacterium]
MEESASIVLDYKDIENVLFNYCFKNSDQETKKQIENTGQMLCNIKTKKGIVTTKKHINFILMYERPVESLGYPMTEKVDVSLTELCNIINETISDRGYEIDEIDDNLIYGLEENSSGRLNFLTFHLKKKEKVKTKKKGCK